MKKTIPFIVAAATLSACAAKNTEKPIIGMANPASLWCQKKGGRSEMVKTATGTVGYCILPSGERIDEWALYRRDHPNPQQ